MGVRGLRRKDRFIASGSHTGEFCGSVEIADTFLARLTGLLGRKGLPADTGLWLHPSNGVHTFGMRFAIDAIALDSEMKVIGLYRDLRAWRIAATKEGTRSVLELPAGHIDASGIALGEMISLNLRDECIGEGSTR